MKLSSVIKNNSLYTLLLCNLIMQFSCNSNNSSNGNSDDTTQNIVQEEAAAPAEIPMEDRVQSLLKPNEQYVEPDTKGHEKTSIELKSDVVGFPKYIYEVYDNDLNKYIEINGVKYLMNPIYENNAFGVSIARKYTCSARCNKGIIDISYQYPEIVDIKITSDNSVTWSARYDNFEINPDLVERHNSSKPIKQSTPSVTIADTTALPIN